MADDKVTVRTLMVGLDNAGKTTALYQLKNGEKPLTVPTHGYNVEDVEFKDIQFTIWDVGGLPSIRVLWYYYVEGREAVIFVVDASDVERLAEAAEELRRLMTQPELQNSVLLVLANKQDLPNTLQLAELTQQLGLHDIKQDWHVQAACAASGDGLNDGLEYIRRKICLKHEKN